MAAPHDMSVRYAIQVDRQCHQLAAKPRKHKILQSMQLDRSPLKQEKEQLRKCRWEWEWQSSSTVSINSSDRMELPHQTDSSFDPCHSWIVIPPPPHHYIQTCYVLVGVFSDTHLPCMNCSEKNGVSCTFLRKKNTPVHFQEEATDKNATRWNKQIANPTKKVHTFHVETTNHRKMYKQFLHPTHPYLVE